MIDKRQKLEQRLQRNPLDFKYLKAMSPIVVQIKSLLAINPDKQYSNYIERQMNLILLNEAGLTVPKVTEKLAGLHGKVIYDLQ